MNILFIAYDFTPNKGGVQRVTSILTKGLQSKGHNIFYLLGCSSQNNNLQYSVPLFCMNKSIEEEFDSSSIILYQNLLKNLNIDLIINQYPLRKKSMFFLKYALPNIKKISVYHSKPLYSVIKIRNQFHNFSLRSTISIIKSIIDLQKQKKLFRESIKLSDKFCLLAKCYIDELNIYIPQKEREKIIAIGNPNTFTTEEDINLNTKKNVIIFVGRLNDWVKNTIDFIKVWELLYTNNPSWRVKLVGDDSNCQEIKKYINENKIKRIEFCGYQKEVEKIYKEAKIICMTSHYEGWPMVLSEAMSYGCIPCVYSSFGAVYEIIDNKFNGVLCPPYNINYMSTAIQQLINDPDLINKYAINAKKKISNFNIDNIINQWEHIIL